MKQKCISIPFFLLLFLNLYAAVTFAYGPSDLTIPSNASSIVYGQSGEGRDLTAYRFGTGKNVMVLGFAIHGWEDNFARDGGALVWAAGQLMQQLSANTSTIEAYNWSVYVLPCMNPDGLLDGYSHNGPGRHTTTYITSSGSLSHSAGVDLNRCFPYNWISNGSGRYHNGTAPLAAKEARALAAFIQDVQGSGTNILIDTHGWTQQIITLSRSDALYTTFSSAFPANTYANITTGRGYFAA
ncbi:MAG: M14 family zinc carboxypeptidase, partial [Oscillospiraceae bacterium]|nr:M14 family zinc carboxypeptidase [Oscillospiraceae bacterium]